MLAVVAAVMLAAPITLDEVRAGARANLDQLKAELELQRASQGVKVARSAILPQLALQANVGGTWFGPQRVFSTVPTAGPNGEVVFEQRTVETAGNSRGNFSLSVGISQLIYDGGRWWSQLAQSGNQQEAAQGQLEEQRLLSEFEAVRRFYELLRAQTSLDALAAAQVRSQTQLLRAKSLYEAGRAQRLDAIDAEINVGNDEISVLRQRQAITSAQVDLLKWLGRPSAQIEAVRPQPSAARQPAGVEQAMNEAKAHRPLLRALAAQSKAAERAVDIAFSAYLPRLSASAAYQRQSPTADPFFTDPSKQNAVNVGATLQWDLFSGLATQGAVEQSRVALQSANASLKQAELDLEGDVRRALDALDVQVKVLAVAQKNFELAKSSLSLAEERFTAGAGSTLEVRDAQVKLTTAQLNVVTAEVDVELARANLYRIVGADVENAK